MKVRLIVLVGPTASGKTRSGVEAAHRLGTEIVSADSRQVYRGLDIGTGKDLEEYRRVSPPVAYHLIDVADPREVYTVLHFQRDCYALLRQWAEKGAGPLLMVGGSGLYVEAVLRGYRIPVAPPDDSRRRELMRREKGELIDELRRRSPELAAATDCNSKRRVVRALEVALHAGDAPFERSAPPPVRIEHSVVALDLPAAELERRIDERLEARLEAGMIEEVERLLAAGVSHERMEQLGLEYREIGAYLAGGQTREAMVESLRRGIRRLAKRQRTWFRGMPRRGVEVRWVEPAAVVDTLVSLRRRP